jgi:hypothetical protein
MNDSQELPLDEPLRGRLARAVSAIQASEPPALALERALSRARAIEPRTPKSAGNGRSDLWRNRLSSLFDQLEDRDLLTAAALCCVAPAELPMSTHSTACAAASAAPQSDRRRELLTPATYSAAGEAWEEALADLWSEEEELAVGAASNDWIATSTACADWTWPG